jgi:hypothetical protein
MIKLRKTVARAALLGAFVVPGLLITSGTAIHAATATTITIAFGEYGPPSGYMDLK